MNMVPGFIFQEIFGMHLFRIKTDSHFYGVFWRDTVWLEIAAVCIGTVQVGWKFQDMMLIYMYSVVTEC